MLVPVTTRHGHNGMQHAKMMHGILKGSNLFCQSEEDSCCLGLDLASTTSPEPSARAKSSAATHTECVGCRRMADKMLLSSAHALASLHQTLSACPDI